MSKSARAWIGTSGWEYKHWSKRFYPTDIAPKEHLPFYARHFCTTEINNSFYKLPSVETYEKWASEVNPDFLFSVKASRYLTHMKKLKDADDPWHRIAGTSSALKDKLGPILLQFPANWKKNTERLSEFLNIAFADKATPMLAFEFRDESWFEKDIIKLLEEFNCALCIVDSPDFVRKEIITASFTYIRYHGRQTLYASKYTSRQLHVEAAKISKWLEKTTTVFAYFNNDAQAFAVKNAQELNDLLS
ncbi:MAG TPA: DUF72 domain-containing protein [Drouetiella sp.]|jgi:uncharacterized protein YecE (DUF72 family)